MDQPQPQPSTSTLTSTDKVSAPTPATPSSTSPAPCAPADSSTLSNTQRDRQAHRTRFQWGNYHNYYNFRTDSVPDARLRLLDQSLFKGKAVLDLGCNAGKLTIESLACLGASRAVGVDIDPVLIHQAKDAAVVAGMEKDERLSFVEVDFMRSECDWFAHRARDLLPAGGQFDLILLLSITKWLHLHAGDSGLLALFSALARLLPTGGVLVVEPQEWANYKAAVKKAANLKPTFKSLRIRPDFEEELAATGLVLENKIAREEGGFSRPLMVWRKP